MCFTTPAGCTKMIDDPFLLGSGSLVVLRYKRSEYTLNYYSASDPSAPQKVFLIIEILFVCNVYVRYLVTDGIISLYNNDPKKCLNNSIWEDF